MRMIIDTDAGVDDAEAIILALLHPNVTVEAITTLTGNVQVDQVNQNICTVLQQTGVSVPVYSGAVHPLIEKWDSTHGFHMDDGLGDWDERPPCDLTLEPEHAVNALLRLVNESPGEITLVTLGPLTNIALALRLDPTFPDKVKQFVFMGGAISAHGNTPSVAAEYNIFIDPEAAAITLETFPKATMISWEATLEHSIPWEVHDEFCRSTTPLGRFYAGMMAKLDAKVRPNFDGHLLPDPLAVAVALQPDLILAQETRHVAVELHGKHTRGQTVVNYTPYKTGKRTVDIVTEIDMDGVIDLYRAAFL